MSFLGLPPAGAWALLAGVAAIVVLLYLLKPSPRRLTIASSLIWQRVLRERKRKPERLRWWLSLLLALAVALVLAAALTQPEIAAVSGRADDVVLIVDTAPTMGARTRDGRTRLAHAIDRAAQLVRAAGAGSRFLVADTMHEIVMPAFEPRDAALARLQTLLPAASGRPWFPDLANPPGARVDRQLWYVTDGVAQLQVPGAAKTLSVYEPADNVGIAAFDLRPLPADPRRHEAYLQILNASPGSKKIELHLAGVSGPAIKRELQLAGGAAGNIVVDLSTFGEGPVRARVHTDDDALALDDVAYAYLPGKGRIRVAVIGHDAERLVRTLRLLPRVDVEAVAPAAVLDTARFDALVFDGVVPSHMPAAPALIIGKPAPWLAASGKEASDSRVERWDNVHPLLSGVSLRDVLITRAAPLKADASGNLEVVARGPNGEPWMAATRAGRRIAVVSFPLEASNFAQQASFPAFVANAIDWLTHEPRAVRERVGLVTVALPGARVLDLTGKEVATRQTPTATLFDAPEPGLFTAVTRESRVRVVVNVTDPRVTAINGSTLARAGAGASLQPAAPVPTDPWILLLALAAALLAVEWWTYNRRVTL